MTRAIAKAMKSVSNLGAQAITEAPIGRKSMLVIRLEGCKYSSTDEPLSERVLYNIDLQLADSDTFSCFFHSDMGYWFTMQICNKEFENPKKKQQI